MEDVIKELEGILEDSQFGSLTRNHLEQTLDEVITQLKEIE